MADIRPDAVEHGQARTNTESTEGGFLDSVANAAKTGGNVLIDAAEGLMDAHPLARFAGTLVGLESPAMRREDLALERGKFELERAREQHELGMKAGNLAFTRAQAEYEDYQTLRPLRNQLAIQSLYEQQYRTTVDPVVDEEWRKVGKEFDGFQMDPKGREMLKQSQPAQTLLRMNTTLGMLKDNNPAVVSAGVEYARRLGVNITQKDGKTYFDAPELGLRGELTPETEKRLGEEVRKKVAEEAFSIVQMRQRNEYVTGNALNRDAARFVALGMTNREAMLTTDEICNRYNQDDQNLYGGLNTLLQILEGGVMPEEREAWNMQLDILRRAYEFNVSQDERGNIFIEGKPAKEWAEAKLAQNPIQQAMKIQQEAYATRQKLQMEARAARKNGIPAEAAPPTVEEREQQAQAQAGKELAEANGMTDWGRTIADRFNRGKAEKDQITPEQALAILGRAYTGWENAMLTTNDPDAAYKAVVKAFQGFGLGESYIPDFFKKAGEDINYENAEAEYKSAKEAARKVPPPTRKQQKIRAAQIEDTRQWRHIAQQSFGFGDPFMPGRANNALAIASLSAPEATPPEVSRLQKARDTFAKAKSRRENREAEEAQARAAQEKNRKKREELRNRLMNKKK